MPESQSNIFEDLQPPARLLTEEGLQKLNQLISRHEAGTVEGEISMRGSATLVGVLRHTSYDQNRLLIMGESTLAALRQVEAQGAEVSGKSSRLEEEIRELRAWLKKVDDHVAKFMENPEVNEVVHSEGLEEDAKWRFSQLALTLGAQFTREMLPLIAEVRQFLDEKDAELDQKFSYKIDRKPPEGRLREAKWEYHQFRESMKDKYPLGGSFLRELLAIIDKADREELYGFEWISLELDRMEEKLEFYNPIKKSMLNFVRSKKAVFDRCAQAVKDVKEEKVCRQKFTLQEREVVKKLAGFIQKALDSEVQLRELRAQGGATTMNRSIDLVDSLAGQFSGSHSGAHHTWKQAMHFLNVPKRSSHD